VIEGDFILVTINSKDFRGRGFVSPGGLMISEANSPVGIAITNVADAGH
jgi:hypothetical protein